MEHLFKSKLHFYNAQNIQSYKNILNFNKIEV